MYEDRLINVNLNDTERKIVKYMLKQQNVWQTRKNIMFTLNLPRSTSNENLNKLVDKGILIRMNYQNKLRGRPCVMYRINPHFFYNNKGE